MDPSAMQAPTSSKRRQDSGEPAEKCDKRARRSDTSSSPQHPLTPAVQADTSVSEAEEVDHGASESDEEVLSSSADEVDLTVLRKRDATFIQAVIELIRHDAATKKEALRCIRGLVPEDFPPAHILCDDALHPERQFRLTIPKTIPLTHLVFLIRHEALLAGPNDPTQLLGHLDVILGHMDARHVPAFTYVLSLRVRTKWAIEGVCPRSRRLDALRKALISDVPKVALCGSADSSELCNLTLDFANSVYGQQELMTWCGVGDLTESQYRSGDAGGVASDETGGVVSVGKQSGGGDAGGVADDQAGEIVGDGAGGSGALGSVVAELGGGEVGDSNSGSVNNAGDLAVSENGADEDSGSDADSSEGTGSEYGSSVSGSDVSDSEEGGEQDNTPVGQLQRLKKALGSYDGDDTIMQKYKAEVEAMTPYSDPATFPDTPKVEKLRRRIEIYSKMKGIKLRGL